MTTVYNTRTSLAAYVDALYSPTLKAISRILADSNGYLQSLATQTQEAMNQAVTASQTAQTAATTASTAATNAQNYYNKTDVLFVSFGKTWYGDLPSDPTDNPNTGGPLNIGARYWNTTSNKIRIYTSDGWQDYDAQAEQLQQEASLSASQAAQYATQAEQEVTKATTLVNSLQADLDQVQDDLKDLEALFTLPLPANDIPQVNADGTGFNFVSAQNLNGYIKEWSSTVASNTGYPQYAVVADPTLLGTLYMSNVNSNTVQPSISTPVSQWTVLPPNRVVSIESFGVVNDPNNTSVSSNTTAFLNALQALNSTSTYFTLWIPPGMTFSVSTGGTITKLVNIVVDGNITYTGTGVFLTFSNSATNSVLKGTGILEGTSSNTGLTLNTGIKVENLTFSGFGTGVSIGSDNNCFRGVTFESGIEITEGLDTFFDQCRFSGVTTQNALYNTGSGIIKNLNLRDCSFTNVAGGGISLRGISTEGTAVTSSLVQNVTVDGCRFTNGSGTHIAPDISLDGVYGAIIKNTTIEGSANSNTSVTTQDTVAGVYLTYTSVDITVQDNILRNIGSVSITNTSSTLSTGFTPVGYGIYAAPAVLETPTPTALISYPNQLPASTVVGYLNENMALPLQNATSTSTAIALRTPYSVLKGSDHPNGNILRAKILEGWTPVFGDNLTWSDFISPDFTTTEIELDNRNHTSVLLQPLIGSISAGTSGTTSTTTTASDTASTSTTSSTTSSVFTINITQVVLNGVTYTQSGKTLTLVNVLDSYAPSTQSGTTSSLATTTTSNTSPTVICMAVLASPTTINNALNPGGLDLVEFCWPFVGFDSGTGNLVFGVVGGDNSSALTSLEVTFEITGTGSNPYWNTLYTVKPNLKSSSSTYNTCIENLLAVRNTFKNSLGVMLQPCHGDLGESSYVEGNVWNPNEFLSTASINANPACALGFTFPETNNSFPTIIQTDIIRKSFNLEKIGTDWNSGDGSIPNQTTTPKSIIARKTSLGWVAKQAVWIDLSNLVPGQSWDGQCYWLVPFEEVWIDTAHLTIYESGSIEGVLYNVPTIACNGDGESNQLTTTGVGLQWYTVSTTLTTVAAYNASFKIEVEGLIDIQKVINLTSINQYLPSSSSTSSSNNEGGGNFITILCKNNPSWGGNANDAISYPVSSIQNTNNTVITWEDIIGGSASGNGKTISKLLPNYTSYSIFAPVLKLLSVTVNGAEYPLTYTAQEFMWYNNLDTGYTYWSEYACAQQNITNSGNWPPSPFDILALSGGAQWTSTSWGIDAGTGSVVYANVHASYFDGWPGSLSSPPSGLDIEITFIVTNDTICDSTYVTQSNTYYYAGNYWGQTITAKLTT